MRITLTEISLYYISYYFDPIAPAFIILNLITLFLLFYSYYFTLNTLAFIIIALIILALAFITPLSLLRF